MTERPSDPAAPWPLATILAGDQCNALPPKRYIQQLCLVRKDHAEHGHPHQNYGGLIWSDEEVTVFEQARSDTQAAIKRTAQQIDTQIEREGHADPALIGDLLFLILGPNDRGRVMPDVTRP